jgi:hypothetical protein
MNDINNANLLVKSGDSIYLTGIGDQLKNI